MRASIPHRGRYRFRGPRDFPRPGSHSTRPAAGFPGLVVAGCAIAAGFYDQAALNKHFRTRFAITPAQ